MTGVEPSGVELLFVYGTLRGDASHAAHQLIQGRAGLVGQATTPGRLYDLGAYPAMLAPAVNDETASRVLGEVYRLVVDPLELWEELDRYEEAVVRDGQSPIFVRKLIPVQFIGGRGAPPRGARAWAYIYNRALRANTRLIACGDYAAHLAQRT